MRTGDILLLLFLGINAGVDLKKKEILLLPTLIYSFCCLWIFLVREENARLLIISCIPGICFLGISFLSSGGIGLGDGWVLLAMGLQLGFYPVLEILWIAMVLMMLYAVVLLTVRKVQTLTAGRHGKWISTKGMVSLQKEYKGVVNKPGNMTIPFVPFLFAAMVLMEVISG